MSRHYKYRIINDDIALNLIANLTKFVQCIASLNVTSHPDNVVSLARLAWLHTLHNSAHWCLLHRLDLNLMLTTTTF